MFLTHRILISPISPSLIADEVGYITPLAFSSSTATTIQVKEGDDFLKFGGIRIHSGKDEKWSDGCIIYSSKRNKDGTLVLDTNHVKLLTKLIFDNKINKIVIINDF